VASSKQVTDLILQRVPKSPFFAHAVELNIGELLVSSKNSITSNPLPTAGIIITADT